MPRRSHCALHTVRCCGILPSLSPPTRGVHEHCRAVRGFGLIPTRQQLGMHVETGEPMYLAEHLADTDEKDLVFGRDCGVGTPET